MHLRYSPCQRDGYETKIVVVDENTVNIDGEVYEFDPTHIEWPTIASDTGGAIIEAHRENGELYVTVRRFYSSSCSEWDTGTYHEA
jgi:hypothetical protein